jgi:hypothetical protein
MNANRHLLPAKTCGDRFACPLRGVHAGQRFVRGSKQQGIALILSLIALAAISLASVALVRSVDTSNVVSGNVSTNETTIQMAELGTQAAYACLGDNPACAIYEDVRPLDATTRLPTGGGALVWTAVASPDPSYTIGYIIERMCGTVVGGATSNYTQVTLATASAPTFVNCTASPVYDGPLGLGRWFYRTTVQVTGPKNSRAVNSSFIGKDS